VKKSSAPGRADFLNTHQDYKGLPVVPAALNLRTYCWGEPSEEFRIKSLNLERMGEECEDCFEVRINSMEPGWFGNYFRGVVNVLLKRGYKIGGMRVTIDSQVPVGSGLSSSAALEVAFLKLLDSTYGLGLDKREIAELAFEAETREVGVPCGRLDQYGCSFGGIIKLECRPPFHVEELPRRDLIFAVVDSGIRHSTAEIHPVRQREINEGLRILAQRVKGIGTEYNTVKWEELNEEEIAPFLEELPPKPRMRILFTLRQQQLTELGLRLLRGERIPEEEIDKLLGPEARKLREMELLGEVMNQQHALLRDLYEVSLPQLERLREACLEAGALGVKLSGAGMGGSLIALVESEEIGKKVVEEAKGEGARDGWVSGIGEGVREEK
jgi:galactokinase